MSQSRNPKITCIMSVGDMASALDHSRARFYQLQNDGIYPPPIYDLRTKRPFYDARLQQICHEIRETGIGYNGQYILFYNPRKQGNSSRRNRADTTVRVSAEEKELLETLHQMGLTVSMEQVSDTVKKLYPEGMNKQDLGVVVREVYRILKQSS